MVTPSFTPGENLSAAKLQQLATYITYTPVMTGSTTDPNMGTGASRLGWAWISGQHATVWIQMAFGTGSSPGSGFIFVSLPPGFPCITGFSDIELGSARFFDSSAPAHYIGSTIMKSDVRDKVYFGQSTGFVLHDTPFTWSDGDFLRASFTYPVAPY